MTIPDQLHIPGTGGWDPLEEPPDLVPKDYFFGTSGYYFDDWVGPFNPPKQPPADRLAFYSRYFRFVEINTTSYRPPESVWIGNLIGRTSDLFSRLKYTRESRTQKHGTLPKGKTLCETLSNGFSLSEQREGFTVS